MPSILIFAATWKKWYRVLRYRKGFGLFDSMRFGLWLAHSGNGGYIQRGTSGRSAHQCLNDYLKTRTRSDECSRDPSIYGAP
jgi:hypothetical protein